MFQSESSSKVICQLPICLLHMHMPGYPNFKASILDYVFNPLHSSISHFYFQKKASMQKSAFLAAKEKENIPDVSDFLSRTRWQKSGPLVCAVFFTVLVYMLKGLYGGGKNRLLL